jgi:hypothetical protein
MAPENNPFMTELESKVAITVTPKIAIQNICDGPKFKAKSASSGVKKLKLLYQLFLLQKN